MKKILSLGLLAVAMFALTACTEGTEIAASTIAIDVNPSIVLELDEDDKVINVIKNNEEADIIVGDMELIGIDYNIAINAIIGSMVANGYINELANSVLLSIQSNDDLHESELMAELTQVVNDVLSGNAINGSVITQELDFDVDAEELAELLDISEAKAELILDIIEADPRVTAEELAQLSINDLNLYLESQNLSLDNVQQTGEASELGIITVEEAYHIALTELGLDELAVLDLEVELEQEDGTIVYEIKIETGTEEYKILIDAKEGIVFVKTDDDKDDDDENDDDEIFPMDALTEETVLAMVLTELGIDDTLISELEIEKEVDNGIAYYEIEFEYDGIEYELEVDALTGEVYTNSMDETGFNHKDDHDEDDDDEDEDHDEDDDDEDDDDDSETE